MRGKQLNLHIMSLAQIMSAVSGSLLQTSTGTQGILNVPCTLAGVVEQCFSTAGLRPGTGPWHQLYRAARGSPRTCHFSFLSVFHE